MHWSRIERTQLFPLSLCRHQSLWSLCDPLVHFGFPEKVGSRHLGKRELVLFDAVDDGMRVALDTVFRAEILDEFFHVYERLSLCHSSLLSFSQGNHFILNCQGLFLLCCIHWDYEISNLLLDFVSSGLYIRCDRIVADLRARVDSRGGTESRVETGLEKEHQRREVVCSDSY